MTLFFVLSGYLITGLLLDERSRTGRVDLRAFYERRIRRLLPALVAVLAATAGAMLVLGRFSEYPGQAVAALFYVANIAAANGDNLGLLGHTWSLSLEEQFYLVWPVLVILRPRLLGPLAVAGAIAVIALRGVADATAPVPDAVFAPHLRADAILIGCTLAIWHVRAQRASGWLALALLGAMTVLVVPGRMTIDALASALLIAAAATMPWLGARWLVRVGQISYGLYLWHVLPWALLDSPALALAATFALALASERWIERPWRLRRHDAVDEDRERPDLARRAGDRPAQAEVVVDRAVVHQGTDRLRVPSPHVG